jgi:diguanylate cyclase (GGDEF)-like protein
VDEPEGPQETGERRQRRSRAQDPLRGRWTIAHKDDLTGLYNRRLLSELFEGSWDAVVASHPELSLIMVDLDGFKSVNDRYGHAIGDRLLRAVAGRLCGVVRRTDTVARLGGDEFTIILEGLRHPDDAARVAEKALVSLRAPFKLDGMEVNLGASLGVAIACHPQEIPDALTSRADAAMYRAKAEGGTGYQFDVAA